MSKVADLAMPVIAAGVLATGAMPAFAGDAGAGEQIFSGNCAACHAGGQNVIMPEKTLEQSVRRPPPPPLHPRWPRGLSCAPE